MRVEERVERQQQEQPASIKSDEMLASFLLLLASPASRLQAHIHTLAHLLMKRRRARVCRDPFSNWRALERLAGGSAKGDFLK